MVIVVIAKDSIWPYLYRGNSPNMAQLWRVVNFEICSPDTLVQGAGAEPGVFTKHSQQKLPSGKLT